MADRIARVAVVGIAFVVAPAQVAFDRVRVDARAWNVEQRTPPGRTVGVFAQRGHRSEPVRTAAAQQLQQQRFGLVVTMMREGNDGRSRLAGDTGERVVARLARERLEARTRPPDNVDAADHAGDAQRGTALDAVLCPPVSVGGQAVVDVDGSDRVAARRRHRGQRVEQDDGIAAAGKCDGNR
jgi:hypothetical protein